MNVSKKIIALRKIYFLKELGFLTIERSKKKERLLNNRSLYYKGIKQYRPVISC